ncbi:MAG: hypothetical protein HYU97_05115 [Deltaproteobacteria bacterium]|nr:hypothetical protein [Deltaproteobacteria bacterium]
MKVLINFFLMASFALGFSACAGHPCRSISMSSDWKPLSMPLGGAAVCQSNNEKLQMHYKGAVSAVSLKMMKHFEGLGFQRTEQDQGEDTFFMKISKDSLALSVDVYDWDNGSGVMIKPAKQY